jgi:hypothetical protein
MGYGERMTEAEVKKAVREVVKYELDSRSKPFKNGEAWSMWLWRTITPERVGLGVLLLFQLGGGYSDVKHALEDAATKAKAAVETSNETAKKADAIAVSLADTNKKLEDATKRIEEHTQLDADIKDRVMQSPTRSEFQAALNQQILPRLERIEKQGAK